MENGVIVFVIDNDREVIEDVIFDFFDKFKDRIIFFECDLVSVKEFEFVCYRIGEIVGKIDVFVNNVVVLLIKWIEERSVDEWDRVIDVNLRVLYLMVKFLFLYLKEGVFIVNIVLIRVLMFELNIELYLVLKGGIFVFIYFLVLLLFFRKIRVNVISLGWIEIFNYKKRRYC